MELRNKGLTHGEFMTERHQVLQTRETGKDVENFEDGVRCQQSVPEKKRFSLAPLEANQEGKTLNQPHAGAILMDEHIVLFKTLQEECDLLPSTIDTYTRLNRCGEIAIGIRKSIEASTSKLNGLPVINHGITAYRHVTESLGKPIQVRHGTPDVCLLAEIAIASGFTSYESGGISYNIPYAKRTTLEKSVRDWQYCDCLMGLCEENSIHINRKPFDPLTGTLIPSFMSHSTAIIEGLLALEQGAKSITVDYDQVGNLAQDIAAIQALRELSHEYFHNHGFDDYELSTVFHQWMGRFSEDEAKAFSAIVWGAAVAGMSGTTKVIIENPREAFGIPTAAANAQDLKMSHQMLNMVGDQKFPRCVAMEQEIDLIRNEVRAVLKRVFKLGNDDIARGTVLTFEADVLDVPFAPAACSAGKTLSVHDNTNATRIPEAGAVPLPKDILALHHNYVAERVHFEGRKPSFQMVIDNINAVSHSKLIGRP